MCLATAYQKSDNDSKILCKNVTRIDVDGKKITLSNIMGEELIVEGELILVDLLENKVIINCA